MTVYFELLNRTEDICVGGNFDVSEHLILRPWGRRVAHAAAAQTSHPFGHLARQGKGWVEIYVELCPRELGAGCRLGSKV